MQNIGELPDVCMETEPGIVDFKSLCTKVRTS